LFDAVLSLAEDKISSIETSVRFKRKIHIIAVEILQNIFHHFSEIATPIEEATFIDQKHLNNIIFILGKNEEHYFIESANFIKTEEVDTLKEKIDSVNDLSPLDLKNKYREILQNGQFSDKGGAGLGIIDIARKSGQKLEYDFTEIEPNYCLFSLKVTIPKVKS
jgi:hypothetical protein